MTDQAADRKNVPKLWDLMKKRGNKKKHDYDPVKERERMNKRDTTCMCVLNTCSKLFSPGSLTSDHSTCLGAQPSI